MKMKYSVDLSKLTLERYRDILEHQTLLPSRVLLQTNLHARFALLKAKGFETIESLKKALDKPKVLESLAEGDVERKEYLVLLRREIGSLEPKSVALELFPTISSDVILQAKEQGIHTSKECYETNLPMDLRLRSFCDLVRINGVGPVAAALFYHAGYHSVSSIAAAEATSMLVRFEAANAALVLYQGRIGLKDVQFCIDAAKFMISLS
jgi:hypothetical protein